ncbi:alpha/beta fold hydrolase [Roseobacter ponti]|uniref:Alpha/beta hydrolase n=1 Tax=Roseobacter ponti TaxID=1891787 RepID=A0A858SUW6_9RHOB|nr:alpha/beta fold hydrolase [Roseobacter ponti]QJF51622.1 alpha/beta hydrolase [Roseobacter ponti]
MRMKRIPQLFSFVLICLSPVPAFSQAVSIEAIPCPNPLPYESEVEGETYECHAVIVPENHDAPGDRTVELVSLRLKSTSLSPMPDPVVYLSGGPGSSALHELTLPTLFLNMQAMRQRRDVIFYDQRGTGHSQILTCGPFNAATGVVGELYPQVSIEELEAASSAVGMTLSLALCASGMGAVGVDMSQYNSVASARDVQAIVTALGYTGDYNLYGTSYGTRLALNALRSTPENVRAVILDGTVTPDTPNTALTSARIQEQYDSIFKACAASEYCNGNFPDLRNRFITTLKQLTEEPLVFDPPMVPHQLLRSRFTVIEQIEPSFFGGFGKITNDGAQGGFAAFLPFIIKALEERDTDALRKILGGPPPEENTQVAIVATPDDALVADDIFLAPSIDLILGYAERTSADTDSHLSDDWVEMIVNQFRERLEAGETQAEVIRDFVDFTLLPLGGTDRTVLEEFARSHLKPEAGAVSAALVNEMTRQDVRKTMWAIQDIAMVMSGAPERSGGIAFGILFGINCPEDIKHTPDQVAIDQIANAPYPGIFMQDVETYRNFRFACQFFPDRFSKDEMMSPVVSDKPALIFQEALDSQTNLSLGYKALETLANGVLLEWGSEGHVITGRSPDGCAGAIAAAFLDRPSSPPDFSCSKAPYYKIPWEKAAAKLE